MTLKAVYLTFKNEIKKIQGNTKVFRQILKFDRARYSKKNFS